MPATIRLFDAQAEKKLKNIDAISFSIQKNRFFWELR